MRIHDEMTVVVPVRNEERNLEACLACLARLGAFAHVVVVDSGSTDRSREIFDLAKADRNGWIWVDFQWNGKFPKKRNWILERHPWRTKWALFLDADELVTDAWLKEVDERLADGSLDAHDAYVCRYDNWFQGRMLKHGDVMQKTALLKIGKGAYERIEEDSWSSLDMEIHEHLVVEGSVGTIRAHLEHHDKRSLESYRLKHEEYAKWEANRYRMLVKDGKLRDGSLTRRQRLKYGLVLNSFFGFAYFCASYFMKGGFLDGKAGFIFARCKWKYFNRIRRLISAG